MWRVIGGRTMTITSANDINSLYNVSSDAVRNSLYGVSTESEGQKNNNVFGSILDAAEQYQHDERSALVEGE